MHFIVKVAGLLLSSSSLGLLAGQVPACNMQATCRTLLCRMTAVMTQQPLLSSRLHCVGSCYAAMVMASLLPGLCF
jgi:hypothetical protein